MMVARFHFWVVCAVMAGTACMNGCSAGPEPTFPVEGVISIDGKPLGGGTVLFEMKSPGGGDRYTARGTIASDGRYRLSTFADGDGAPAGQYRVAVLPQQAKLVEYSAAAAPPPIPLSYGSVETSGLEYVVKPGPNTINIELFNSDRRKS
ncbi:MAG: hypothetical protein JW959_05050 [Pirellulales bacterium]|nr:hypothetical protein [Pirellulales bacterium]